MRHLLPLLLAISAAGACAEPAPRQPFEVLQIGTMREALRMGRSEGRVDLDTVMAEGHEVGVGALAGLTGEVTLIEGMALVSRVEDGTMRVDLAEDGEEATLLIAAAVEAWDRHPLPPCRDYAALEVAIAAAVKDAGFDPSTPTPIKVEAPAEVIALHVIDGACPIANPTGPPPLRHREEGAEVRLVGFFVEGAAGVATHHDRTSHLHAAVLEGPREDGQMAFTAAGHLDEVILGQGGILHLPRR